MPLDPWDGMWQSVARNRLVLHALIDRLPDGVIEPFLTDVGRFVTRMGLTDTDLDDLPSAPFSVFSQRMLGSVLTARSLAPARAIGDDEEVEEP
jgi:hypothetical protein